MNSEGQEAEDAWAGGWQPIDSPPPDGVDVLVVVREDDGELLYTVGHYWAETEYDPAEGLDGTPLWCFEGGHRWWPRETLVKWRHLPPI